MRSGGPRFSGIGRQRLLNILRAALGNWASIAFETEATSLDDYRDYDLIVGGRRRQFAVRAAMPTSSSPISTCAPANISGSHASEIRRRLTSFSRNAHGWIWAHAYQFDADTATFIVECSERPGATPASTTIRAQDTIAACERIFARF